MKRKGRSDFIPGVLAGGFIGVVLTLATILVADHTGKSKNQYRIIQIEPTGTIEYRVKALGVERETAN